MVGNTQSQIIEYIKKKKSLRPGQLSRLLGISPQALHRHLRTLASQGVLRRVGQPPQVVYQLAEPEPRLLSLEQKRVIEEVRSILGAHPAVKLVTLFGSFARGEAGPASDIDLLVWLEGPREGHTPFDRHDLWNYWDRHARHLPWRNKVSLVIRRFRRPLFIDTLLLDLPEEHLCVYDRDSTFGLLKDTIKTWRTRNGSAKLTSFGGKHSWKYSTHANSLDAIDFQLELPDVP